LRELIAYSGIDIDGNGEIYLCGAQEGDIGYASRDLLVTLYGEKNVEEYFTVISDYAIYISAREPGEIAIFECFSRSDTDLVAAMCFERSDELKVALRGGKDEEIQVKVYSRFVILCFTESSEKLCEHFAKLIK
jgi:hypothetical protein